MHKKNFITLCRPMTTGWGAMGVLHPYTNPVINTNDSHVQEVNFCLCNNNNTRQTKCQKHVNKKRDTCDCVVGVHVGETFVLCKCSDIQAATKEHHDHHQQVTAPTQNTGHCPHALPTHKTHMSLLSFTCSLSHFAHPTNTKTHIAMQMRREKDR
jgi:hypothetical protein